MNKKLIVQKTLIIHKNDIKMIKQTAQRRIYAGDTNAYIVLQRLYTSNETAIK